ncbi:MAG TPA: site-2 protease family protein [Acidimicrobiales bacterium]|nr:site-2 protease family protein [Acidimicrobiales bacterium]
MTDGPTRGSPTRSGPAAPTVATNRRRLRSSHHRHRRWALPLGRIAGIRISVHVTFFFLVALVALVEAEPGGLGVGGGLVWLAILFACVLAHELAHSLVAIAKGATVRSIVLLPIGGVSEIEHLPERWSDELAVAVVGPLTNVVLAVLAGAAAVGLGQHLLPVELWSGALLPRLAWTNLLLGAFNLLPAYPLDGGRVLEAVLERRHGFQWATHRAASIGRWLGAAMALLGLVWNLWFIVIGLFVVFSATVEEQAATVRGRLRGVPVRQLMRAPVHTLDAAEPLAEVGPYWKAVPQVVTSDGRYVGMVEPVDLDDRSDGRVGDVTDRAATALDPAADIGRSALDQLLGSGYPVLAVVADGKVVGVLVLADVVAYLDNRTPRR